MAADAVSDAGVWRRIRAVVTRHYGEAGVPWADSMVTCTVPQPSSPAKAAAKATVMTCTAVHHTQILPMMITSAETR